MRIGLEKSPLPSGRGLGEGGGMSRLSDKWQDISYAVGATIFSCLLALVAIFVFIAAIALEFRWVIFGIICVVILYQLLAGPNGYLFGLAAGH